LKARGKEIFLHAVRCQHGNGFDRTTNCACSCAGEKLFSIRLRSWQRRTICLPAPPLIIPSLVTFFGMIPNFESQEILPKLASLIRSKDFLLFSANLAPGENYAFRNEKNYAAIRYTRDTRLADDISA